MKLLVNALTGTESVQFYAERRRFGESRLKFTVFRSPLSSKAESFSKALTGSPVTEI